MKKFITLLCIITLVGAFLRFNKLGEIPAGLHRDENPALRLRKIPRRRHHAHHTDEVGGRSHGDRQDFQGSPAESHPGA